MVHAAAVREGPAWGWLLGCAFTQPLSEPELTGREAEYLQHCIETGWVSSGGPFVTRMESLIAERVGA